MRKLITRSLIYSSIATSIVACSGGGGGSGSGAASSSMLGTNKMSCNGSACIGDSSMSLSKISDINVLNINTAVELYDFFNNSMIPGLNQTISIIEDGAEQAEAESCDDIELGFSGQITLGATSYDVKSEASSATAPSEFTTTNMAKNLAGRITGGSNYVEADVACGAGTSNSPLVARVLADNGTDLMNAWFEKGGTNHIRVLMVVKSSGVVSAAWFKTNDGDSFEIVLARAGSVYKAVGSKTLGSIKFSDNGAGDVCLNAVTGESASNCGSLSAATSDITVTGIPNTLLSANTNWSSIADNLTLVQPSF